MIVKLAWKNIWRNPLRSTILITAIAIGVWALVFINGLTSGMIDGYVSNAIANRTGHIQIHSPQFVKESEISHVFESTEILKFIAETNDIQSYTPRVIVNVMASSASSSLSVKLIGIDSELEHKTTQYQSKIIAGEATFQSVRNPVFISDYLAQKMNLKVGSKIVTNFQNKGGEITSAVFRVAAIMDIQQVDNLVYNIYCPISQLRQWTGLTNTEVNEITLLLRHSDQIPKIQAQLLENFNSLSIKNYKELAPDINLMSIQLHIGLSIMIFIFMLALIFGIINTMLMAVLERYKEIGMLMAVGMNKAKLFRMIVIETLFLSLVGLPVGILLGSATISYYQHFGLNLENWARGLEKFGMSSILYPQLSFVFYLIIAGSVLFTAIMASIYPAKKAIQMNPIETMKNI